MKIYCDTCYRYVGDFTPESKENVAILEGVRCTTCQANGEGASNNASLSSAHREALEGIALYGNVVSPTGSMVRSIVDIARQALDLKPEDRAVTREELAKEIHDSWDIEYLAHQPCEDIAIHPLSTYHITRRGERK